MFIEFNISKMFKFAFPVDPPNDVSDITADLREVVGIIRTILSISFAEIKFCSSRKKY